jgi:hypothetical protein
MNSSTSGLRLMLPSIIGATTGGTASFFIVRTRRIRWALVSGAVAFVLGTICLALLQRDLPQEISLLALLPAFVRFGLQNPGTILAILAVSEQSEQAVVTRTHILWRSLSPVVGVAASGFIVQSGLGYFLDILVRGDQRDKVIERVTTSIEEISKL